MKAIRHRFCGLAALATLLAGVAWAVTPFREIPVRVAPVSASSPVPASPPLPRFAETPRWQLEVFEKYYRERDSYYREQHEQELRFARQKGGEVYLPPFLDSTILLPPFPNTEPMPICGGCVLPLPTIRHELFVLPNPIGRAP